MTDDDSSVRDPHDPQVHGATSSDAATLDADSSRAGLTGANTSPGPRRNFLVEGAAIVIGGIITLVPLLAGMLFFLDPLIRRNRGEPAAAGGENGTPGGVIKDADGFIRTNVSVESLPADGTPQLVTVYDDRVDAWNRFPNQPIGTVWLRKTEVGDVQAFNTVCPHLGCSIGYRNSENDFFCPCHNSTFKLGGEKQNQIPPRDMDPLEVRIKEESGDAVWLKYENFRAATHERIPV